MSINNLDIEYMYHFSLYFQMIKAFKLKKAN